MNRVGILGRDAFHLRTGFSLAKHKTAMDCIHRGLLFQPSPLLDLRWWYVANRDMGFGKFSQRFVFRVKEVCPIRQCNSQNHVVNGDLGTCNIR